MDTVQASSQTILVLDPMEFRREGIAGAMEAWARSIDADIVAAAPADVSHLLIPGEIGLVVLSLGGASIGTSEAAQWICAVRACAGSSPIAILSDIETPEEVMAVLRAGAQGLLPTSLRSAIVLHALAFIQRGGTYFPPALLLKSYQVCVDREEQEAGGPTAVQPIPSEVDGLTHRQHDVLALLRQGRSNKLIARALDMQESTVKVHVRQIMRKMGAANRTQAALMAAGVEGRHGVRTAFGLRWREVEAPIVEPVLPHPAFTSTFL